MKPIHLVSLKSSVIIDFLTKGQFSYSSVIEMQRSEMCGDAIPYKNYGYVIPGYNYSLGKISPSTCKENNKMNSFWLKLIISDQH